MLLVKSSGVIKILDLVIYLQDEQWYNEILVNNITEIKERVHDSLSGSLNFRRSVLDPLKMT